MVMVLFPFREKQSLSKKTHIELIDCFNMNLLVAVAGALAGKTHLTDAFSSFAILPEYRISVALDAPPSLSVAKAAHTVIATIAASSSVGVWSGRLPAG